jgi:hypothetical protein
MWVWPCKTWNHASLQWMQKRSKQHYGMQSSPNHFLDLLKFESKTLEGKLMSYPQYHNS